MGTIFRNIWEMSLFAVPVILLLAVCSNFFGKRYGAKWRYLLWLVVAVRLCIPIQFSLPEEWQGLRVEVPAVQMEIKTAVRTESLTESAEPMPIQTQTVTDRTEPPTVYMDENSSYQNPLEFLLAYPEYLWGLGVVLFVVWQAWKYAAFQRMLKRNRRKVLDAAALDCYYELCREMGMSRRPEIYFCEPLPSPLCVGFLRPTIYINSEDREKGDLYLILKHELTHCRRKDLWFKGILMLSRALHFFNPFVHIMAKLAEKDMELSCDMAVMKDCSLQERETYSMAILRTVKEAKHKNMGMSTAFFGGKEELKMRFENIFDMGQKKRGIALFVAAALLISGGTAFVGCAKTEKQEETTVVYGAYTEEIVQQLYDAKLDFIGNHIGVGKIMGLLPLPDGVTPSEEGMELFTGSTPYGVKRHLNWADGAEISYPLNGESYEDDRWFQIHAMIFLALVENADYFGYDLHGENAVISKVFDLDMAKTYFGEQDLKAFAADEETFRNFVLALNRYFYEGISSPQEMDELLHLDTEKAQERMQEMLSGESNVSGKSFSYRMIYADSLVHEIATEQNLTSSNPLDYINCAKYEELVKIGEPALREFLIRFAEGYGGDTLEGYIMMYACQDILGEGRQTDFTPTEWFAAYFALDSVYVTEFACDEKLYTADLQKKYCLDKDADKWSIAAASTDARLQAVYTAVADRYQTDSSTDHKVFISAPYIHKIVENGAEMQVFAEIYTQELVLTHTKAGYGFFDAGGSMIPTRLDFKKENGEWRLTNWTEAEDGSNYADSIREMCKGHIGLADKMMGESNVHELMWQNVIYYMKANYGEMDITFYSASHVEEELLAAVNKYISLVTLY